jgi:hypothetical protein
VIPAPVTQINMVQVAVSRASDPPADFWFWLRFGCAPVLTYRQ